MIYSGVRIGAFLLVLACGMFALGARADAASEICPASMHAYHEFEPDAQGLLYSFALSALSPRTASGTIAVDTNDGYFTFAFPDVAFTLDRAQFSSPTVRFERDTYLTKPLFVRFPVGVTKVNNWWVIRAHTTGESVFGWDARGSFACALAPLDEHPKILTHRGAYALAKRSNPPPYNLAIPPGDGAVLAAVRSSAPGDTSCAVPFAAARPKKLVTPLYPIGIKMRSNVTVLVKLTIAADGSLVDASIYQPAPFRMFDNAALDAVKSTTYQPAISFCRATPSNYMFRADFDMN